MGKKSSDEVKPNSKYSFQLIVKLIINSSKFVLTAFNKKRVNHKIVYFFT